MRHVQGTTGDTSEITNKLQRRPKTGFDQEMSQCAYSLIGIQPVTYRELGNGNAQESTSNNLEIIKRRTIFAKSTSPSRAERSPNNGSFAYFRKWSEIVSGYGRSFLESVLNFARIFVSDSYGRMYLCCGLSSSGAMFGWSFDD